jgi:hypothetical protein
MNGGPVGMQYACCLKRHCGCGRNEVPGVRPRTAAYLPMPWDVRFRREGADRSRPNTIFQSTYKPAAGVGHRCDRVRRGARRLLCNRINRLLVLSHHPIKVVGLFCARSTQWSTLRTIFISGIAGSCPKTFGWAARFGPLSSRTHAISTSCQAAKLQSNIAVSAGVGSYTWEPI